MAGKWADLFGTSLDYFRIGLTSAGYRIKRITGGLAIRDGADSADAELTASKLNVTGNDIVLNSDAGGSGSDRTATLSRNSVQSANLQFILPGVKGTDGQALVQKAGTASGVVELEYGSISGGSGGVTVDTTSLASGSTSTVSMFTLPANNAIFKIEVIIDTTFDGTPSMSVGISGTASKYVASTQVDLKDTATTSFEINPNIIPSGSTEALQIAYTQGSATVGAARVLVYYGLPV
jgi:hypothetical protein